MNTMNPTEWPLVRFVIPAFPEINIFTRTAKQMTPLGTISVATSANKIWGWRVEVIDENNYRGPRDAQGLPDHDKLEQEGRASVVGFYCGLSSTMDRVFDLARFYRGRGTATIAGGWHAHYCPEELLSKNVDIVVHGDGEIAVQKILHALKNGTPVASIPGISFRENGAVNTNPPTALELDDLNELPYPDFGLLRHAKKIRTYSIGRVRGCRMNCEFCSVKGKPRWASPEHVFGVVNWLVETRRARRFFIVDDRLEENLEGLFAFFEMVRTKYGDSLAFAAQIRLEAAKNIPLLEAMKGAGVRTVAVGYESPIDEDLKAMRKGYTSRHMLEWTEILRRYFWVHAMFIFGYPNKEKSEMRDVREITLRFKAFIRKARFSSVQILHPVPIVGSDLRKRLEAEGRLFPLELVPWSKYDGNYVCFAPKGMSPEEFQETPIKLMGWFYSRFSFLKIPLRTVAFPLHYLVKGWHHWHRGWLEDIVKYGGHRLVRQWRKGREVDVFVAKLKGYIGRKGISP